MHLLPAFVLNTSTRPLTSVSALLCSTFRLVSFVAGYSHSQHFVHPSQVDNHVLGGYSNVLLFPSPSAAERAECNYPVVSCVVERLPHKSPFAIVFRVWKRLADSKMHSYSLPFSLFSSLSFPFHFRLLMSRFTNSLSSWRRSCYSS